MKLTVNMRPDTNWCYRPVEILKSGGAGGWSTCWLTWLAGKEDSPIEIV